MAFLLDDDKQRRENVSHVASPVLLDYLKKLPPPAVDLELRALCSYEQDEEGLDLLRCWITWLTAAVSTGDSFEVLQAYLHRTLTIYSELATNVPSIASGLARLSETNATASGRFREMIQKNLCLLKMMANIPIS